MACVTGRLMVMIGDDEKAKVDPDAAGRNEAATWGAPRGAQGEDRQAEAQEASVIFCASAVPLVRVNKVLMPAFDAAKLVDGFLGRPVDRPAVDGPDARFGIGPTPNGDSLPEGMAEHLECDVIDSECQSVGAAPERSLRFHRLCEAWFVRESWNCCVERLRDRWLTRTVCDTVAPPKPNVDAIVGLLNRIEGIVFRFWYDVRGWLALLQHECGLDRPCG